MIVFISDLHMSDGTFDYHDPRDPRNDITHDISAEAFALFWDSLHRIVSSRKGAHIREITVVLLGDSFEMRSSTRWVASDYDRSGRKVRLGDRPWKETRDRPSATCLEVFEAILRHNQDRLKYLTTKRLRLVPRTNGLRKLAKLGIRIRFEYLAGNHDSLLIYHRDPVLRDRLSRELGWTIVPWRSEDFPAGTKYVNPDLLIAAEHGHRCDKNDYFNDNFYDAPVGCVTVDALGRFMLHLQRMSRASRPGLPPAKTRELVRIAMGFDNVRPSSDAYRWMMSRIPTDPETRRGLREALRLTAQDLLADLDPILDFIFSRTLTRFRRSRLVRALVRGRIRRLVARLAKDEADLPLRRIMDGISDSLDRMSRLGRLFGGKPVNRFHANALREVQTSPAKYVLYGHAHRFQALPLVMVDGKSAFYFNTGTWKKTLARNRYDTPPLFHFQGWSRMTYIMFFNAAHGENKKHVFELWHGNQKFVEE